MAFCSELGMAQLSVMLLVTSQPGSYNMVTYFFTKLFFSRDYKNQITFFQLLIINSSTFEIIQLTVF